MTTMFKHPRLFTRRAVLGRDIRRATKDNPTAPRHAFLSPETSAQTGRIRAFNYQGAIMDAVTDPLAEKITAKKSTRVGYTKILDHIGKQKLLKRVFGNGSSITFVGANSPGGFRRTTSRIVLFDEVDDYRVGGPGSEEDAERTAAGGPDRGLGRGSAGLIHKSLKLNRRADDIAAGLAPPAWPAPRPSGLPRRARTPTA